jgi:hypothetical protein
MNIDKVIASSFVLVSVVAAMLTFPFYILILYRVIKILNVLYNPNSVLTPNKKAVMLGSTWR